jgi:hypothetical protein
MLQEIHNQLINDLKDRNIKAWQIKKGVTDNPYPISQNYIWFLSKPQFMDRVKLASLYRMKIFFESQE